MKSVLGMDAGEAAFIALGFAALLFILYQGVQMCSLILNPPADGAYGAADEVAPAPAASAVLPRANSKEKLQKKTDAAKTLLGDVEAGHLPAIPEKAVAFQTSTKSTGKSIKPKRGMDQSSVEPLVAARC
jgi:hypothetical protein